MHNKLILLDIDGTLIDYNYKSNCQELPAMIQEKQKEGMKFALNSNRSIEDLIPIASQFKIEGPLIGENGLFSYDQKTQKCDFFISQVEQNQLISTKEFLEDIIQETGKKLFGNLFTWINIDTVNYSDKDLGSLKENSIVVLNNKFRKFTISAHVKKVTNSLSKDLDSLLKIVDSISHILPDSVQLSYSENFSNILIYSKHHNKRTATKYLKDNIYKDYEFIAIGDELGDYEMIKGIGKFYTVSNSSDDVKKKAKRISSHPYSSGVYELVKFIRTQE